MPPRGSRGPGTFQQAILTGSTRCMHGVATRLGVGFAGFKGRRKQPLMAYYQMVKGISSGRHSHGFRAELSRDLAILSSSGYEKRGLKLKIIGLITPSASKRYGTTTG